MFNEFITIFHTWYAIFQLFFILVISLFLTNIVVKILSIINNVVSTLPILFHGWPEKTKVNDGDVEEKEEKEVV